jgi:hypothetical protein
MDFEKILKADFSEVQHIQQPEKNILRTINPPKRISC